MDPASRPFGRVTHPSLSVRGQQSYQNQMFVPRNGQRKIYFQGRKSKLESQLPCDNSFQHKSEIKNTRPFKFKRLPKSSPICKNTFQENQRNFSSGNSLPTTNINKDKPSLGRTWITGGERNTGEGCHEGGNSLQGLVCQPPVPSIKDGGQRPVINLKELNTLIPYKHFKMEGLQLLKEIL